MTALLVFLSGLPHLALERARARAGPHGRPRSSGNCGPRPAFFDVRLLATNLALSRTYLRFALTSCASTPCSTASRVARSGPRIFRPDAGLLILPMAALSAADPRPISQRNLVRGPADRRRPVIASVGAIGVLLLGTSTPVIGIVAVTLIFGVTLERTRRPTKPRSTPRSTPTRSPPRRACCAPSAIWVRSGPPRSSASSSTPRLRPRTPRDRRDHDRRQHHRAPVHAGRPSLRKPVGSEAPTNRPPATHRKGEKAMHHIRPSTRTGSTGSVMGTNKPDRPRIVPA